MLIQFSGEVSDNCKKYLAKKEALFESILCLVVSLIFITPLTVVAIVFGVWILFLAIGFIAILPIVIAFVPKKKSVEKCAPKKFTIRKDLIDIESKKDTLVKPLADVSKVIDMGEWYQMKNLRKYSKKK